MTRHHLVLVTEDTHLLIDEMEIDCGIVEEGDEYLIVETWRERLSRFAMDLVGIKRDGRVYPA